ncbi:MAG: hypothetical protein ACI9JM_002459 [Halioglobus sp.]|jgi:hypothetical protein
MMAAIVRMNALVVGGQRVLSWGLLAGLCVTQVPLYEVVHSYVQVGGGPIVRILGEIIEVCVDRGYITLLSM